MVSGGETFGVQYGRCVNLQTGPGSSSYSSSPGVEGVMGSEPVDGVDGCIREVRKQVGVGAD
jgi:hypothetical protein